MAAAGKLSRVPAHLYVLLSVALLLQALFWSQVRGLRAPWAGVGPAPSETIAQLVGLGDRQLAYRAGGLALQQLGDSGGVVTPLKQYDYDRLVDWFEVLVRMDTDSDYIPTLAGYYFGHSPVPAQARKIALFLREVAVANPERHWRWLAHAVYLARHQAEDMQLALELAADLNALPGSNVPIWARQLNAFVLADVGETEAARDILEVLLATNANLPAAERYFIERYIRDRLSLPLRRMP